MAGCEGRGSLMTPSNVPIKFKSIRIPGGGVIHLPLVPGLHWPAIFADPNVPVIFINKLQHVAELATRGVAAIGVSGVSRDALERWLMDGGADVVVRQGALH